MAIKFIDFMSHIKGLDYRQDRQYRDILENNEFDIDSIIAQVKLPNSLGKYEFILKDNSIVAISEESYIHLCRVFEDKYQIADYMSESLDNFKEVMKLVKD